MREKYVIGITHGDYNGIGYEIILKTFADARILELFTPVVYGVGKAMTHYKQLYSIATLPPIRSIRSASEAKVGCLNLVEASVPGGELQLQPGTPTLHAGAMAATALTLARQDLAEGVIDAVATAPIHKDSIQSDTFIYKGHTEFFGALYPECKPLMTFVSGDLRVALATIHEPLRSVPALLTRELLMDRVVAFEHALKYDFGIVKPKIAVLGLNPHAGENGLIGDEEQRLIKPTIEEAWKSGIYAFGPASSDAFWGNRHYQAFDGVLALYHDQGLIPFKMLAMEDGVNVTCGLPIVRTSPDHGTAFDIAGKGIASEVSMRNAVYRAIDILTCRKRIQEAIKNPLKKKYIERGNDNYRPDLSSSEDDYV